ncbi:MAG: hypothetical protein R3E68_05725 [Burkholderiaceae bacterium]
MYARAIAASRASRATPGCVTSSRRRWLVRSIEQRMTTIERVGAAIVERQQAWFDHGDIALKPMTLAQTPTRSASMNRPCLEWPASTWRPLAAWSRCATFSRAACRRPPARPARRRR